MKIFRPAGKEVITLARGLRADDRDYSDKEERVAAIIRDVKIRGDAALMEYTERFDGVHLAPSQISIGREELDEAISKVRPDFLVALKALKEAIERYERLVMDSFRKLVWESDGIRVERVIKPLECGGCYVPGGRASYPSTLLMTVVPALIAGVPRVAVCSPPSKNGKLGAELLAAAYLCGVQELYRVGGAQAIAALAYGTESIKPVDKIVGPGNVYVTLAKRLVSKDVPIDMPAGPSELLILAGEHSNPTWIAKDLISQAEHGEESACGLVTTSERVANQVNSILDELVASAPRREVVEGALASRGFIVLVRNMDEAIDFANCFAPEHLEVHAQDPRSVAESISYAGTILLGPYTPAAATDYAVGSNHILPTSGKAKHYSPLSCLDFTRWVSVVECSEEALRGLTSIIRALGTSEGLVNHVRSVEERFS